MIEFGAQGSFIIAGAGDDNIVGDGHVAIYAGNNSWDVVRIVVPMTPENGQTGDPHIMNWQEAWSTYPEAVKTSPDSTDIIYAGNGGDSSMAGADDDEIRGNGGNRPIASDAFPRYRDLNKYNIHTNQGLIPIYD